MISKRSFILVNSDFLPLTGAPFLSAHQHTPIASSLVAFPLPKHCTGLQLPVSELQRGWKKAFAWPPALLAAIEFFSLRRSHWESTGQTLAHAVSLWKIFLLWHIVDATLGTLMVTHLLRRGLKRHFWTFSPVFSSVFMQLVSIDSKQTSPGRIELKDFF